MDDISDIRFSDDDTFVEPSEIIKKIEEIYKNELYSPHIQPHHFEWTDLILQNVKQMEVGILNKSLSEIPTSLIGLEIQRLKYLISSYYRKRIFKIENDVWRLHDYQTRGDDLSGLLSEWELTYYNNYKNLLITHFSDVLAKIPLPLQDFTIKNPSSCNNFDGFVFVKVVNRIENVRLSEKHEPMHLDAGSRYFVPFSAISDHLKLGNVILE